MFNRRLAACIASPLLALSLLTATPAWSQISVSVRIAPPVLPVYVQPELPGEGYIWTPGYWGWSPDDQDYYWVPGTWVRPPVVGYLWTPGYWAFETGGYRWRLGYWGRQVGFYGGVNYGFGYTGRGYLGGRWTNGRFFYNRSVNNIGKVVIRNVYNVRVVNPVQVTRVSFNGGPNGVRAQPTAVELKVQKARRVDPTPNQVEHERAAKALPAQRASANQGKPQIAATPRPTADAATDQPTRPARAERDTPRTPRERPAATSAAERGSATAPAALPDRPRAEQRANPAQQPRVEQPNRPERPERPERQERAARDEARGAKERPPRDER